MKPFNIERALAGDKVVTADGREVTQLVLFYDTDSNYRLYGVLSGKVERWDAMGVPCGMPQTSGLGMAPKERTVYINVVAPRFVPSRGIVHTLTFFFDTEDEAKTHAGKLPECTFYAVAIPHVIEG